MSNVCFPCGTRVRKRASRVYARPIGMVLQIYCDLQRLSGRYHVLRSSLQRGKSASLERGDVPAILVVGDSCCGVVLVRRNSTSIVIRDP